MDSCVITAPGQGVQQPGMLEPWLEAMSDAPALLDGWSAAAGLDLIGASRDSTRLEDTAVVQPLIVAASLLSLALLTRQVDFPADGTLYAGHSVGELAAAAGAGYLSPAEAVRLARTRGTAMSRACRMSETGMAAVMPSKHDAASEHAIVAAIQEAGLTVANWNGSHQFVAAGPADRLDPFVAAPPAGMRVARLAVAGAFHTGAMDPAAAEFSRAVAAADFTDAASALVGNGDGTLVTGPDDLRWRLTAQVTSPVRWDRCAATIAGRVGDGLHIELAPAGPLTRLLQRARPGVPAIALYGPADVEKVRLERDSSWATTGCGW
jgi:[acyl-carrier-protein] S-malonyltransferase